MPAIKKVYVIGTRGFPDVQGGVEKHCEKLYPLLSGTNFEFKVFRRKPYVTDATRRYKGIVFKDLWSPKSKHFETFFHSLIASLYCITQKPDIVHIHNIGPAIVTPILKIAGIKTIVTYHSPNYLHEKWGLLARSILKFGEIITYKMTDKIIIISRSFKNNFSDRNVTYIPNGVEIATLHNETKFLDEKGIIPNNYILTVSRFSPEKGLHILIRAFHRINKKNIQLVIVGDSDHNSHYSRRIKDSINSDNRIIKTGFITGKDLDQIYSHARLFVLPSFHEGLSIAALEALSFCLPIIVSDIPANREFALPDELFPAGDVYTLANLIEKHLVTTIKRKNEENLHRQQWLMSEFNWHRIARQTARVYADLTASC